MEHENEQGVGAVAEGDEFPTIVNDDLRPLHEHSDPGQDAVKAVKNGSTSSQDLNDATAWFLSEQDANVRATKTFEINVSADPEHPHFVEWTVQAIPRERIRQIRRQSRVVTRRGMTDDMNEVKVNLLIACEGTVKPNLAEIAAQVGAPETTSVMERRFSHKPGLIDQIAGEVLSASGYDEDDVRDVAAGKR